MRQRGKKVIRNKLAAIRGQSRKEMVMLFQQQKKNRLNCKEYGQDGEAQEK